MINLTETIFFHPLDQFETFALFLYWPNIGMPIGLTMITNLTVFCALVGWLLKKYLLATFGKFGPNLKICTIEMSIWIKKLTKNNIATKRPIFFPTLFFLFLFVFLSNMIGMLPYSYTVTSSFALTFFLALGHFIGINIIAIFLRKWKTLNIFLPGGVPAEIAPFLMILEVISYIARIFSLSIRLFANMMAGHTLLKILITFAWGLLTAGWIYTLLSIIPWLVVSILVVLEIGVAYLQAYVFTLLVAVYLNDVMYEH